MSERIPQSFIQDVLARTDIVELIQQRISLNKRGNRYLARCPFHDEKTPSFNVNPEKQFYYCFGCSAHGNVIGFLMAFDRIDFLEALSFLAQRLSLELPHTNHEAKSGDASDYELLAQVDQFYQRQMRKNSSAIHYLKSRGLNGTTAKYFHIGFATNQWDCLLNHVGIHQSAQNRLLTHGLLIQKQSGGYYDRFRNRIIFPIRDARGRPIAFGGRTISDENPKYLNSPETPFFHKSHQLYGLHEARQQNSVLSHLILVEGYLDVILLHQNGIKNAVATLGTAINSHHLQLLFRYTEKIIICFDGDIAGKKAAWKALTICLPLLRDGLSIRFLFLPDQEDPASFVQKYGPPAFHLAMDQAQELSQVFFSELKSTLPSKTLDDKASFAKKAMEYLNTMPVGIYYDLMIKQLADTLEISLNDLQNLQTRPKLSHSVNYKPLNKQLGSARLAPAYLAIAILLRHPKLAMGQENQELCEIKDNSKKIFGLELLQKVLAIFRADSNIDVGQLLARLESSEEAEWIAFLAAKKLDIPEAGFSDEFRGAVQRLKELNMQEQVQLLIEKAKSQELSSMEKKLLNQLLIVHKNDRLSS